MWTSRSLDCTFPDHTYGTDLFVRLLHLAARRGYRVYFLAPT